MEVVKKDKSINEVTKEYDFGLDRMVEKKMWPTFISLLRFPSQFESFGTKSWLLLFTFQHQYCCMYEEQ